MNAHSEWIKWRDSFGLGLPNELTGEPVTLDWRGVTREGAFKAGYMASQPDETLRKELGAARRALEEVRARGQTIAFIAERGLR